MQRYFYTFDYSSHHYTDVVNACSRMRWTTMRCRDYNPEVTQAVCVVLRYFRIVDRPPWSIMGFYAVKG